MYGESPFGARFRRYSTRLSGGFGWLIMIPGLILILAALAIIIWPQLLAYLVAGAMFVIGALLISWGWAVRRLERNHRASVSDDEPVVYRVL
jgi:uncharacterized membrane protein